MANPFTHQTGGYGQQKSVFGQTSPFGATSTGFGTTNQPSEISSGFGTGSFGNSPASGFGSTGSSVFGRSSTTTGGFGGNSVGGFVAATGMSGFRTTQTGSEFGSLQSGSGFGTPQSGSGFGTPQSGSGFGTPQSGSGFGTSQSGSGFGTSPSGSGFGSSQSGSGFGTSQSGSGFGTSQSGSGFGILQPGSGFGTSQLGSGFGTSQSASGFGTSQSRSGFGTSQSGNGFGSSQSGSGFGISQSGSGFGTSQSGSGFGTSVTNTGFGNQSTPVFGGTSNGLGFATSTTSGFSIGTFGNQTQTGTSLFTVPATAIRTFGGGSSFGASTHGSGFGNQNKAQSTFGGFGPGTSSSTFGGGFGTVSQGSNVFGSQATQSSSFGVMGSQMGSTTFGVQSARPCGSDTTLTSSISSSQSTVGWKGSGTFGVQTTMASGLFGQTGTPAVTMAPGLFGQTGTQSVTMAPGLFGQTATPSVTPGVFSIQTTMPSTVTFGTQSTASGSFGLQTTVQSTGIFGKTGIQSASSSSSGIFGQTGTQLTTASNSTGLFGQTGAPTTASNSTGLFGGPGSFGEEAGSSTIFRSDEKRSDSSKNVFGKPELKIKPHITELNPPSTVLYPVSSPDSVFGGSNKTTEGTNPLFGKVRSSEPFGKSVDKDDEESQKGSTKKILFGKPVAGTSNRRRSLDQPGTSTDIYDQTTKRKPSKENDEEPQSKMPIRRMSSTDDMTNRVAIICNYVPNKYNKIFFMKKHFSKFGEVVKVFPNPRKFMTTIHFKTHEAAREAKSRGKFLDKGVRPMEIFWSSYLPSPRRSSDEVENTMKRRSNESIPVKHTTKSSKFKWARNDLDDELASMSGTNDVAEEQMKLIDRPEETIDSHVRRSTSPGPSTSRTAVNIPTKVDTGSVTVLRSTVCHTSAEKLQILNLRDKIIRLGMKKTANLKSKAFVGSCTDMCPERERYDREEKRRLHVYEILNPGSQNPHVNHSRAVKEYSRSSADQEEPLSHELRPLSSLILTMNYLLSEIADRGGDGKWGDWFDFLWDRTRGIRKDITQQQISTPDSAELLEKCVRFHIFCSARLCEEDMHTFDLKINSENMTKCLQTLKEFYHDLETKQNTFCRNEAEIWSYLVLMNLNEDNILRETQQLRPEVRNTSYINFAIQVHSALNSNNFVRFFKLAKSASFLPACIMHRYFTQVRTKALLTLIKAYRPKSHYSLTEMVRILEFENKIEARYFCKFHGLNVTEEIVILDKTSYVDPEDSWPPRRSQKLIESKLDKSVGEIINGETLPTFSIPPPVNSFDENQRFIGKLDVNVTDIPETDVKAVVQDKPALAVPQQSVPQQSVPQQSVPQQSIPQQSVPQQSVPQQSVPQPEVKLEKLQYTNDDVKDIAKHLFWEVIEDMAKEVSVDLVQGAQMMSAQTENVCDLIIEEVVTEYVSSLSQSYYTEVSLLKQKKDKEMMIQNSAVHFTSIIIKDIVDQEVLNLATAEVREIKAQLKREQIERCNIDLSDDLVELVIKEMSEEVAEEVYQKDVIERLEELEEICHCIELQRAGKHLKRWKKEFSARIKLKRCMLEFPPAVGMTSNYDQVKRLIPSRQNDICYSNGFYVNNLAKLKIDTLDKDLTNSWVVDRMLSAHELYRKICYLKAWQPLDVASTVSSHLQKHVIKCKSRTFYWKLVLSVPDINSCKHSDERDVVGLLNKWLRSKFTKGKDEMSPSSLQDEYMLSLYRTKLPYNHIDRVEDFGVCIRSDRVEDFGVCIRSAKEDLHDSDFFGSNGLIFVLPPGLTDNLSSKYWSDAKTRLQTFFQLKPSCPAIPLVVMVPLLASENYEDLINTACVTGLDIADYVDKDLVSSVFVRTVNLLDDGLLDVTQPELTEELCESVQWLAEAYPQQPDLTVQSLKAFINDYLLKKFFDIVLHNLKLRKANGYLHQFPEQLVQLYNHVISHMTNVLTSETLKNQSWPISEFFTVDKPDIGIPPSHWNSEDHIDYIEHIIEKLQLPWFLNDDFEKDDWSDICEVVWEYIDKVADDNGQAKVDLFSKIRLILKNTEEDFADICYLMERETRCEPSHENIPWTDVITACIDYKLSVISFLDVHLDQNFELLAVYFKKDLDDYHPPDSWKFLESDKDIIVTTSVKSSVQTAKNRSHAKKVEQSLNYEADILPKSNHNADINLEMIPECVQAVQKISSSLATDLKKEQSETEKYERFLKNALIGEEVNDTDIPDPWNVFDSSDQSIPGDHVLVEGYGEPLVTDELDRFKRELDTNRRASDLYENQLRKWLGSPV